MSWKANRIGMAECVMAFREVPTKLRPRGSRANGIYRTYTPRKTMQFEQDIRLQWREAVGERWKGHEGEVRVFIEVQRPLSKSNPKYWAGRSDLMKPDADNLAKVVCDSLNGLAYVDDSQITQLAVTFAPRVPYRDECAVRVRVEYHTEEYVKEKK